MKGVILCAGLGTRLRPFTHTTTKHLLPLANKPLLFYVLEALQRAEIREVGMVVSHNRDQIGRAVGHGEPWGMRVTYIEQHQPLGLAHGVAVAQDFLGDSPFILYLGDNLLEEGVAEFVEIARRDRPDALVMLKPVPNPREFGVAVVEHGRVTSLAEKPSSPASNLAVVGVYAFTRAIHEAIASIRPSARGELEITDAIHYLIQTGHQVVAYAVNGWWKDAGRPEDLIEANELVLRTQQTLVEGAVDARTKVHQGTRIEASAHVSSSEVGPYCTIGPDSAIENTRIGPFVSVATGVTIRDTSVRRSIILDEATIESAGVLADCIIGRKAILRGGSREGCVRSMCLGDDSVVVALEAPGS